MDAPTEKQCTKCLRFLPLDGFNKNKNKKHGRASNCKECVRKYYEANCEKERQRKRKYYKANREKVLKSCCKYCEANREKQRQSYRKHYKANREKVLERNRKWREANPEKVREYDRNYREANPEKKRHNLREWKACQRATKTQQAVFRGLDAAKLAELKAKLEQLETKPKPKHT